MPRKVFESISDLKEWAKLFATPDRYIVNLTIRDQEIIIEPKKSTRPLTYCYYKIGSGNEEQKKLDEFLKYLKDEKFSIVRLKSYDWDTERYPGVRMRMEE